MHSSASFQAWHPPQVWRPTRHHPWSEGRHFPEAAIGNPDKTESRPSAAWISGACTIFPFRVLLSSSSARLQPPLADDACAEVGGGGGWSTTPTRIGSPSEKPFPSSSCAANASPSPLTYLFTHSIGTQTQLTMLQPSSGVPDERFL